MKGFRGGHFRIRSAGQIAVMHEGQGQYCMHQELVLIRQDQ